MDITKPVPILDEFEVVFAVEHVENGIDQYLLQIVVEVRRETIEEGVKELDVLLGDILWWYVCLDQMIKAFQNVREYLFNRLVLQLLRHDVTILHRAHLAIQDHDPELPPNHTSL